MLKSFRQRLFIPLYLHILRLSFLCSRNESFNVDPQYSVPYNIDNDVITTLHIARNVELQLFLQIKS